METFIKIIEALSGFILALGSLIGIIFGVRRRKKRKMYENKELDEKKGSE